MQEQVLECDACAAVKADVLELNTRLQKLEHSHARTQEAFIKNDLGLPDYDGHRNDHKVRTEEAKVVEGYKRDATKRLLDALVGALIVIFGTGFWAWMKEHLK